MYLARKNINGKIRYYIRESYPVGDCLHSRDLFDLGADPDEYIIYPGGNAFYISDTVEERLRDLGVTPDEADMDDIFWPFLRPDIRHAQDHFRGRSQKKNEQPRFPETVFIFSTGGGSIISATARWIRGASAGFLPVCFRCCVTSPATRSNSIS